MKILEKLFITSLILLSTSLIVVTMTMLVIVIQRESSTRKSYEQCIEEGYKEYICVSIIEGRHIVNAFQNGGKK